MCAVTSLSNLVKSNLGAMREGLSKPRSCEFNTGILADRRNGLAEISWSKTTENAESCSWGGITSCTGDQLKSSFAEKILESLVDTNVYMSQECVRVTDREGLAASWTVLRIVASRWRKMIPFLQEALMKCIWSAGTSVGPCRRNMEILEWVQCRAKLKG